MPKMSKRDPFYPRKAFSAYQLYEREMKDVFLSRNPDMCEAELALYTEAMFEDMPEIEMFIWIDRAEHDKQRYLNELHNYIPSIGYDVEGNLISSPSQSRSTSPIFLASSRSPSPFEFFFDEKMPDLPSPCASTISSTAASISSRKNKPKKDPAFPKRPLSAYMLYQNHVRRELKDNPGITFGQIATHSAEMYRNMNEEERAYWNRKSQEDKERFRAQIAKYVPTPGYDRNGALIDENSTKKKKKPRAPKDANSPKRAAGAYVFFANEMRPKLQKELPGIRFIEIGRILGERWRKLSVDEKAPYEKLSTEDKARYRREMKEFKSRKSMDLGASFDTASFDDDEVSQASKRSRSTSLYSLQDFRGESVSSLESDQPFSL